MEKKAQVWIETVTYTLIAFVMIGLVLSFAKPKIEELQDKTIIEQSIKVLKEIDSTILEISEEGVGNKRKVELGVKKGNFYINSSEDKIIFELKGRYMFSELGGSYEEGVLNITTQEYGTMYLIRAERDYSGVYNITYDEKERTKVIGTSPMYYNLYIDNKGKNGGSLKNINFLIA
jgi:hypothetical protein